MNAIWVSHGQKLPWEKRWRRSLVDKPSISMQQASLPQGKRKAKFMMAYHINNNSTAMVANKNKWVLLLKFLRNRASIRAPSSANCKKTTKSIEPVLKVATCTCKLVGWECKTSHTREAPCSLFNHTNTSSWIRMPPCTLTKLPSNLITKTALYLSQYVRKIDLMKTRSNRSLPGKTYSSCKQSFRTTLRLSFKLKSLPCMRSTVRLVNQHSRENLPKIQKSSRVKQ